MKAIKDTITYLNKHKGLYIVIVPAFILTLLPFIFDGQTSCVNNICGFIVGTNYRDGIWFQAVAATAFKTFPFQMPNYAGEALRGYHYLPNLFAYILSFLGIPITFTYYKLVPIVYMLLITVVSVQLGKKIQNHPLFVGIFLFFTYFGMHLSLITSLYHFGEVRNQVLINTFQATRILESPHTAIALIILFSIILLLYQKKLSMKFRFLISFFVFLSFGIKFYVACSIIAILFFYELFQLIKTKNMRFFIFNNLIYAVGVLLAIFLFYDPMGNSNSGSVFVFSPFATVHHLIESPDMFYLPQMILARYYLYEHGWSPRLILIELFSSFLFVLFYFGTRIVGLIQIVVQIAKRKFNEVELAITCSIVISIACSLLFIQKGDWFNPIQFAVPAAFLSNIFAAKLLYSLLQKSKILGIAILFLIIIITFPANLSNLFYLSNPGRFVIPQEEMDALNFLKKQPNGVVFAPIDENDMAYVSAFTGKPTYVNFVSVLENAGINFEKRLSIIDNEPMKIVNSQLVDYIYIPIIHKKSEQFNTMCENTNKYITNFKNKSAIVCIKNTK